MSAAALTRSARIANGSMNTRLDDKLQSALHENVQLKRERNELQAKLRKVETQFRRLVADWRRTQGELNTNSGRLQTTVKTVWEQQEEERQEQEQQRQLELLSEKQKRNQSPRQNRQGTTQQDAVHLYRHFRPATMRNTLSQKATTAAAAVFRSLHNKSTSPPQRRQTSTLSYHAEDHHFPLMEEEALPRLSATMPSEPQHKEKRWEEQANQFETIAGPKINGWLPQIERTSVHALDSNNSDNNKNTTTATTTTSNNINKNKERDYGAGMRKSETILPENFNRERYKSFELNAPEIHKKYQEELLQYKAECAMLKEQLHNAFLELEEAQNQQLNTQSQSQQLLASMRSSLNSQQHSQQQMENEYKRVIETLTRENDKLKSNALQKGSAHAINANLDNTGLICQDESLYNLTSMDKEKQLAELQTEVQARTREASQLQSRLETAEQEMGIIKEQCTQLVNQIDRMSAEYTKTQRELFAAQHAKSLLEIQCAHTHSLETSVQEKNNELLHMEQELVKLTNAMQTCHRETEHTVREEYNIRISEQQQRREMVEAELAAMERKLLDSQHTCHEAESKVNFLTERMASYEQQIKQLEREKAELYMQLSHVERENLLKLNDDEVQRAIALAALRKRRSYNEEPEEKEEEKEEVNNTLQKSELKHNHVTYHSKQQSRQNSKNKKIEVKNCENELEQQEEELEESELEDEYELLHWDETWEKDEMRKALSIAALDIELANTRCQQMKEQIELNKKELEKVRTERNDLYSENVELRRRLTRVQTVFAKEQLANYYEALASNTERKDITVDGTLDAEAYKLSTSRVSQHMYGQIDLIVDSITFDNTFVQRVLQLNSTSEPVSLFLSLDGLSTFETMLSPTFVTLAEASQCEVHFQYADLEPCSTTLKEIQETKFVLQLHHITHNNTKCSSSNRNNDKNIEIANESSITPGTEIVAMAELAGNVLLAARSDALKEVVPLITGSGEVLGHVHITIMCKHLLLPIDLDVNIAANASSTLLSALHPVLSSEQIQSAKIALRNVSHLRIQIYRVDHLPIGRLSSQEQLKMLKEITTTSSALASSSTAAHFLQPYVFYTACNPISPRGINPITDTTVHPLHTYLNAIPDNNTHLHEDRSDFVVNANNTTHRLVDHDNVKEAIESYTVNAEFDSVPADHRVMIDTETILFFAHGSLVFVVFDALSHDTRCNLGVAQVALKPLLQSSSSSIMQTIKLQSHATISVGISWVTV